MLRNNHLVSYVQKNATMQTRIDKIVAALRSCELNNNTSQDDKYNWYSHSTKEVRYPHIHLVLIDDYMMVQYEEGADKLLHYVKYLGVTYGIEYTQIRGFIQNQDYIVKRRKEQRDLDTWMRRSLEDAIQASTQIYGGRREAVEDFLRERIGEIKRIIGKIELAKI